MSDDLVRDPKTGRFSKGHSGFKGRSHRKSEMLLPHQWAEEVLRAAAHPVEVTDRSGRIAKLPAYVVSLRQLAGMGSQKDKCAIRQFSAQIAEAVKALEKYKQKQFDQLGLYLQSIDEGRPWPLDESEAAYYQDLADKAGMRITIQPFDPNARPEPVRPEMIDAVLADPAVARALRDIAISGGTAPNDLIRRALRAYEQQKFKARRGEIA